MVIWEAKNLVVEFNQSGAGEGSEESETDYYAGLLGFMFTFCFGFVAHLLGIFRISKFVETLRKIDAYDERFNCHVDGNYGKQRCLKIKRFSGGIIALLIMYTPIYMMYKIVPILKEQPNYTFRIQVIPYYFYIENTILGCIYLTLGFIILEVGVSYIYFQLFHLGIGLKRRLEHFKDMIESKLPKSLESSDIFVKQQSFKHIQPKHPHLKSSWDEVSEQYIEYRNIINTFQEFSSSYFAVMYLSLIISTVCMTYYLSSENVIAKECGTGIRIVVWISFGRISDLADCGYFIQTGYESLVKSVMRLYQETELIGTEKQQACSIVKLNKYIIKYKLLSIKLYIVYISVQFKNFMLLLTKTKLSISSAGFFTVNRQNFTSVSKTTTL